MKNLKLFCCIAIFLVLIASLTQEVEARRKILKGRRTITRTYYKAAAIPPWAIVFLVSLGELLIGLALFFVLKKFIVDPELQGGSYSPPQQMK